MRVTVAILIKNHFANLKIDPTPFELRSGETQSEDHFQITATLLSIKFPKT